MVHTLTNNDVCATCIAVHREGCAVLILWQRTRGWIRVNPQGSPLVFHVSRRMYAGNDYVGFPCNEDRDAHPHACVAMQKCVL